MSIASEIQRIKTNISNAYDTVEDMNGTLPATKNSANLADAISTIPQGGQPAPAVVEKDVNFYDYDGTLVHSYTKAEFLALTEMPSNPQHSGLTAQGWNWSLANAKNHMQTRPYLDIGQNYITDNGETRFYINVDLSYYNSNNKFDLHFNQSVARSVIIDWGDGSTTTSGDNITSASTYSHTYSISGKYVVRVKAINNSDIQVGSNFVYTELNKQLCYKIEVGSNLNFGNGNQQFTRYRNLKYITIPNYITNITSYMFSYDNSLEFLVLPKNVTEINNYAFSQDNALKKIVLNDSITTIGGYICQNLSIDKICLSDSITSIGAYAFSASSIKNFIFPKNITTVSKNILYNMPSHIEYVIFSNVTQIDAYACGNNVNLLLLDFSNCTSIPVLENTNAFSTSSNAKAIFVIPDLLYDTWKTSTNWTRYSSKMVKASEV